MYMYIVCGISLKKNVMIRIEDELVEKAREIGLNISKVSENALKDLITRIEGPNRPKDSNNDSNGSKKDQWWGRPDLNRGPERPRLRA